VTPAADVLSCPGCGAAAFADDEFCEACGADIAARRDLEHRHVELDDGAIGAVSDVGLVHVRNDDAFHVEASGGLTVAIVCDGVSNAAAPQVAAVVAARAAAEQLLRPPAGPHGTSTVGERLVEAVQVADEHVQRLPWTATPERTSPACTVVAACWDGTDLAVAWAGDSRAYWCTDGGVRQLTSDHSWATEVVAAGHMTPDVADADRRAHTITRWLGEHGLDQGVDVVTVRAPRAGRLLLCTDGLWNHVPNLAELEERCEGFRHLSAAEMSHALAALAMERGGTDNVTVVVVDIDPVDDSDPAHAHDQENEESP
jgi:serine/threonine protein phosphatase PrpC